ncbi:MAG: peptide deformylase [Verrucomicrobiota bacterium]
MILDIATFDHPALRAPGSRVEKIDARIHELAADMIETMRHAEGLGLAAQQIGRPLQMFVLDVPQMKKRPSAIRIDGKRADFESLMPLVLLNAEVETFGKIHIEGEGCLSFPEVSADVARPLSVRVKATLLNGSLFEFEADGLLARAVQHELDHTQGILFIDRATPETRAALEDSVRRLARPAPMG